MTSKSLCFKLMKEDLKRRVWAIALTILSLVFCLLIPVALECSTYLDRMAQGMEGSDKQRMIINLVNYVGLNGLVVAVLLGLCIIWAVSGFRYLHNSRQVDFYHSIPVKRHHLFLTSYLNGIVILAVIYLVIQVLSVLLILRTGIGRQALGNAWWKIYLINMVYYWMLYTTVVIAMMMTGNLIIALLGTGVFIGYGPAMVTLIMGYQNMWFHTLFMTQREEEIWMHRVSYSSPFANYMFSLADFASNNLSAASVIKAAAVAAALAIVACGLYQIRPSEAAGKAMAFKKTETPIKLLIAVPVSVVFGMFFYVLRSTLTWAMFGALCGGILTCCIMEIIYHFDFRKLFAHKLHLAGCCIAGVLLVLAGMYDWYGYDSWLPRATDLKTASVTMGYEEDWVTYGGVKERIRYNGDMWYGWEYGQQTQYQFDHMELADVYSVMELAQKGVQANKEQRKAREEVWSGDYRRYCLYTVQFRLNGGRTVSRQYRIPMDEEMKTIRTAIHDSKEYKKGTYPLLEQTAADTTNIYFQQYNHSQVLELTTDEKAHLLAVYQKELEELTMAAREKELPIGTIQFRTVEMDEAIAYNEEHEYYYDDLENRCYYPVYPSFTRTLEAIEAAGIKLVKLDSDSISDIRVIYYWTMGRDGSGKEKMQSYTEYEENVKVYSEKEDIDTLAPALVFNDYRNMNTYYELECADNVDVTVTVNLDGPETKDKGTMRNFQVNLRKLSPEEMARFELEKEE